jgi:hypothetical protein
MAFTLLLGAKITKQDLDKSSGPSVPRPRNRKSFCLDFFANTQEIGLEKLGEEVWHRVLDAFREATRQQMLWISVRLNAQKRLD